MQANQLSRILKWMTSKLGNLGSRFDAWIFSHYRNFNAEHELYTFPYEPYDTIDINKWATVTPMPYIRQFFRLCDKLQRMHLYKEEVAILKAMSVFSPDRCATEATSLKVESIQMLFVEILNRLYLKNHPYTRQMLPRTVSILTQLRTLESSQRKQLQQTLLDFQSLGFPRLFFELINTI